MHNIDITVDMNELDLTVSEAKATYQEIKDYIKEPYDVKVSSLYIAQIKQKHGIIERENYNTAKSENAKQPQCPSEKEKMVLSIGVQGNLLWRLIIRNGEIFKK